jgi:acyl carrier protein
MDKETRIRKAILDALDAGYVAVFREKSEREKFLAGTHDYLFDSLNMDSLGRLEFCVSLEINGVFVITPEELKSLQSLNDLVSIIAKS